MSYVVLLIICIFLMPIGFAAIAVGGLMVGAGKSDVILVGLSILALGLMPVITGIYSGYKLIKGDD